MRYVVAAALILIAYPSAFAAEPAPEKPNLRTTIDRGLAFIAKDALAWKAEHNCASCHHAALAAWSMHEAKQHGHAVDETVLADLMKWMAESGEGKTGVPRPASAPKALNFKPMFYALALAADPKPSEGTLAGMKTLLGTVKGDQMENGSWQSWPETRPPIFGHSDESATALAVLSLLPAANSGDESAKAVRDKGVQYLIATKPSDESQTVALRLMLWKKLDRPAAECAPLVELVKQRQNTDGGWSQSKEMASDAWATGQALYALTLAGLKPDDPYITRGHAFLVKTQREDGSWPMTSRPTKPGGEGSKSLIPITGAGSAWAIIGLARSE